jgi:thiol-disulfide isomerase/thioredoxin
MKKLVCTLTSGLCIVILLCCTKHRDHKDYLKKVLVNLEQIKSASYNNLIESYAPGDTAPAFTSSRFYREYRNLSDTTIGSSYVSFLQKDTSRMTFCYDGKMRAIVYEDEKIMVIDSFKNSKLPFRPITPPFFNYTESILRYALDTKDSVSLDYYDHKDSLKMTLTIFAGKQVEFFGKAFYMNDPYSNGDEVSKYTIWIDKKSNLPYRCKREMSHDISVENISAVRIKKGNAVNFIAETYFPSDLMSVAYGSGKKPQKNDMQDKKAPDWVLHDADNNSVGLNSFKNKVLLIQFTSVSCGPCKASIPFLKQLSADYQNKDFNLVSIESWTRNSNVLKNYRSKNNFNYSFLMSTDQVTKDYKITSVPVFFILDRNHVIKKIITGYGEGTTDNEIREAIGEML